MFAEYDPVTQNIVVINGAQIASIRELDPITWRHSTPISLGQWLSHGSAVLRIGWGELLLISEAGIHAASLEDPGTIRALTALPESVDPHSGVVFDPNRGVLVLWGGDKEVRTFDPETLEWTVHTSDSGPTLQGDGIFSKWIYIEELDVFAGYDNVERSL